MLFQSKTARLFTDYIMDTLLIDQKYKMKHECVKLQIGVIMKNIIKCIKIQIGNSILQKQLCFVILKNNRT